MVREINLELLHKICKQCDLGTLKCSPVPLTGGLLHKMYSLVTEKGKYAVKLLNPYIMRRDTAQENYRIAEELESVLEHHGIPVLPALQFTGHKMQKIDGQFFYLYDWYDGKALKHEEIEKSHCERIGELLAAIHGIDRREMTCGQDELHVDWNFYIDKLSGTDKKLYRLIAGNGELLYEYQTRGNLALKRLPAIAAICHNDMDSKNVLWDGRDCRIIDLECLSYSNPFLELYEMALSWSGYEMCHIDYSLFQALIQSYQRAGGELPEDWEVLCDSNLGRLEWLEYNLKRALGIECAPEEREIGISEVYNTVAHLVYYREVREEILNCF